MLDDLLQRVEAASLAVLKMKNLTPEQLNWKPGAESWSILECLEHLNLYGDFYLVELEKSLLRGPQDPSAEVFKSGMLGDYFARLMQPQNGKIKKMNSPKDKNPAHSDLPITTLERFLKQQERMVGLLRMARGVDLTKAKTPITLTKFVKLRAGDTFRFVIYHIERHIAQAERLVQK